MTLALIAIYLLQSGTQLLVGYLLSYVGVRLTIDLRQKLYEHLQTLSLSFFNQRRTGELVSRVMNDVSNIRGVLTADVAGLLQQVLTFLGALVVILYLEWRLPAQLALGRRRQLARHQRDSAHPHRRLGLRGRGERLFAFARSPP